MENTKHKYLAVLNTENNTACIYNNNKPNKKSIQRLLKNNEETKLEVYSVEAKQIADVTKILEKELQISISRVSRPSTFAKNITDKLKK